MALIFMIDRERAILVRNRARRSTSGGRKFHLVGQSLWRVSVTEMERAVRPIEIQSIEGKIGDDPSRDVFHVFVINDEIASSASSVTNRLSFVVQFAGGMLIKSRSDSSAYMLA
jgi:hypothetical protein